MKISDIFSSLVAVWIEWQKASFLINPRYIRQDNTISWQGYETYAVDEIVYYDQVINLVNRGQYTFQINSDGSLIQLHYVFDRRDTLLSANLSYFSIGIDSSAPVGWLRIDYDPSSYRGALHPKCHMHLSLFPTMRFIVDGVPTPKQFVDFIALTCYPEIYQEHHIDENGNFRDPQRMHSINSPSLHLDDPNLYQFMTHIRIPEGIPAKNPV